MDVVRKELGKDIDLGENIRIAYQQHEIFANYYSVYYGHKFSQYYFRDTVDSLKERAKFIDSCYLIFKGDKVIGGVILKPNFMSDLFIIPPFDDYNYIAEKITEYLIEISDTNEKILLQEIIEEFVPIYEKNGFKIQEKGFWMIRPTEEIKASVPEGYVSRPLHEEDKNEVASLILTAYTENPSIKIVYDKETYLISVNSHLKNKGKNGAIYDSSRVVVCMNTGKIVGVSLYMEFENMPLLTQLAVCPEHQGKGIGRYLVKYGINCTSKKYSAIRLYVFDNNPAKKLYDHLGFINNGSLNDMYMIK
ncbi:GNAT family N-acetyltransferase [Sporosalibacterium faouarense]|uniref:GNAT family N-acetyltransferase n=1 Tax=Sporosalibacterium faouarense TaxID=516123 RepID=UPI00141C2C36|nr:GNAT family N-acetyltransferase [Sporosalibacterium faouarense]MTI47938.1 GNAT family N-acetyltransferase [Bacillota bacterium]